MRDWEEKIARDYPWLFPKGAFGMAVGNGWADLLSELCRRIDLVVDEDWKDGSCCLTDVKEKYGLLRVSYLGPDEINRVVDWAEEASARTCDECGRNGRMRRKGGWLLVRCDAHEP